MVTLPTINPNGTLPDELLEQHELTLARLCSEISALAAAAPIPHETGIQPYRDQTAAKRLGAKIVGKYQTRTFATARPHGISFPEMMV